MGGLWSKETTAPGLCPVGCSFKTRSSIPTDHPHCKQSRTEDGDLPHVTHPPAALPGPQRPGREGGRRFLRQDLGSVQKGQGFLALHQLANPRKGFPTYSTASYFQESWLGALAGLCYPLGDALRHPLVQEPFLSGSTDCPP